jgi:CRISPR-associated Csx2 family protein
MSKVFISFLGTSDYLNCRYSLDDAPGGVVKYVQEDLVQRCCKAWTPEDEIRIFTTADAVVKNWQDNGHKDWKTNETKTTMGLEKTLEKLSNQAKVKKIDIPMGNSEEEVWEIFHQVYSTLRENEEIVMDITHGFRSLPVLLMALIGYSRLLKNISVTGLYYGAFEILGTPGEASKIPEDQRIAPVFDLTSFEQIIEWTEATQSFVKNGAAKELKRLTDKQINPVLKHSGGESPPAKAMGNIVRGIETICRNISMNRGADIIQYDYEQIKSHIQLLPKDDIFIKPLVPLFSVIENKIAPFARDDINNGFKAVDWCVFHGMIQQAITMLQENMVTFLLVQVGEDWGVKKNRTAVSETMKIVSEAKSKSGRAITPDGDEKQGPLIEKLKEHPFLLHLVKSFEKLRSIRIDVNHGGYNKEENDRARSSLSIQDKFDQLYKEICKILCNNSEKF